TELNKVGIATTDTRFPADGVDLSPAFQKAMDGKPDLIFMEGAGNQAALLLSGRIKAGAENVPTLAGGTVATQPLLTLAKGTNQLDNVSIVMLPAQHYIPPADRSEVLKEFLSVVKKQGPLVSPLNTYAAGWDIVALWADAVATIDGEVTSEKINEAMKHIPASAPRLMFQKVFTPTNNYVQPTEGDFVIGIPTAVTDGMFEYK
ncbi:MAG: hypothetical protein JWP10_435, partial [Nocardioidaceae bacterium]|nr:hypothetical protein [Nocardioidaceae bacterium]